MRMLPLLLVFAIGCATPRPGPDTPVVEIDRLEDALSSGADTILKVPAGTRLPVDVRLDTPLARVEGGAPAFHLVFDKTVYWYPKHPAILSFDGEQWHKVSSLYRGSFNFGVHKRKGTSGPRATFSVALQPR